MSNEADQADELIETATRIRLANIATGLRDSGITECRDCLIDIPPARRETLPSAVRCLDCQEIKELRG